MKLEEFHAAGHEVAGDLGDQMNGSQKVRIAASQAAGDMRDEALPEDEQAD